ncbi:MAG: alpha-L-glutamate ligase-like protein [Nitrospinota bacterium]|nr:alpha-L-glutamate ligase-like protein [Nitrospinota bacterium]
MKLTIRSITDFYENVLGINQRNLDFIYPMNPREHFPIANDKIITKEHLALCNIATPETYCILSRMGEINSLWEKIDMLKEFVIKPAKGKQGGGILVLEKSDDGWITPSLREYGISEIRKHIADIIFGVYSFGLWDRALIEYRVHSHQVFLNIFPHGVADIRIILCNNSPIIGMVRIPTVKSNGKANLHQGAIGIGIDMKSGVLTEGYNKDGYYEKHPDSSIALRGIQLPFWDEILKMSVDSSLAVPLKYLGVDIVIDSERGVQVMEINARPGLEIQNVNRKGLRGLMKEYLS